MNDALFDHKKNVNINNWFIFFENNQIITT